MNPLAVHAVFTVQCLMAVPQIEPVLTAPTAIRQCHVIVWPVHAAILTAGPTFTVHLLTAGPTFTDHLLTAGPTFTVHLLTAGPTFTVHLLTADPGFTGTRGTIVGFAASLARYQFCPIQE